MSSSKTETTRKVPKLSQEEWAQRLAAQRARQRRAPRRSVLLYAAETEGVTTRGRYFPREWAHTNGTRGLFFLFLHSGWGRRTIVGEVHIIRGEVHIIRGGVHIIGGGVHNIGGDIGGEVHDIGGEVHIIRGEVAVIHSRRHSLKKVENWLWFVSDRKKKRI